MQEWCTWNTKSFHPINPTNSINPSAFNPANHFKQKLDVIIIHFETGAQTLKEPDKSIVTVEIAEAPLSRQIEVGHRL